MGYIPDPEDMTFAVINQEPSPEEARIISEHIAEYRQTHTASDIPAWMKKPLAIQTQHAASRQRKPISQKAKARS